MPKTPQTTQKNPITNFLRHLGKKHPSFCFSGTIHPYIINNPTLNILLNIDIELHEFLQNSSKEQTKEV